MQNGDNNTMDVQVQSQDNNIVRLYVNGDNNNSKVWLCGFNIIQVDDYIKLLVKGKGQFKTPTIPKDHSEKI